MQQIEIRVAYASRVRVSASRRNELHPLGVFHLIENLERLIGSLIRCS